jgi:hypothetical protein
MLLYMSHGKALQCWNHCDTLEQCIKMQTSNTLVSHSCAYIEIAHVEHRQEQRVS